MLIQTIEFKTAKDKERSEAHWKKMGHITTF